MSKQSAARQHGNGNSWAIAAASAVAVAALIAPAHDALGAAKTWDGGGDPTFAWTSGANWDLDTAPVPAADNLVFTGTLGLTNTNDFAANSQFNGISFNSAAGAFTLAGNAINLGGDVVSTGSNLQTIDLALALTAGRTLFTAAGSSVRVNGVISGGFDLNKRGLGTLTLTGANTYTGRTGLGAFPNGIQTSPDTHHGGGKLILDFSAAGAPVSNILYNGVALTATQELRPTSGSLEIIGKDATANAQSVGALGLSTGFGNIKLTAGAGGTVVLNLGAIQNAAGAGANNNKSWMLNIDLPSGVQDATNGVTTTTGVVKGLLSHNANITAITVNKSDWATKSATGNNIVPYVAYTANTAADLGVTTDNVDYVLDTTQASGEEINTLRFNTPAGGANTNTLTLTSSLRLTGGGLLVTNNVGPGDVTITGGSLQGNSNRALFIYNYNTSGGGSLVINSAIVNNTNTNSVNVGGGGTVVFGGNNTYTNSTYVHDGTTLSVSADANLGINNGTISVTSASTASPTVTLGATAPTNTIVVGSTLLGRTITAIAGTTVTLDGVASADIAAATLVSYATANALNLSGGTLRATGTFALEQSNSAGAAGGTATDARNVGMSLAGGTFDVTGANVLTVNGVVSNQNVAGVVGLKKTGTGTLVLGGTNTYVGGTTIAGGTITAASNAALGASGNTLTFASASGGTFQLGGRSVTMGGLVSDGTAVIENSAATNGTLVINSAAPITIAALMRDGTAGRLQLTKQNSNSLTLTNANTHSGDTLVSSGNLVLGNALAMQQSTINQQGSGVIVFDAGAGSQFTVGGLKNNLATHTIVLQDNAPTPAAITLSLGNNNQSTSYSGAIAGPGSLTKVGSGTLTASQVKVGGAVAVDGGTLAIATNGGASGMLESTALTVADGMLLAMNDNDFIVNYGPSDPSPEFALRDKVKAIYQGGTSGISYTVGAGDVALAVAERAEWGFSEFNGVALDTTAIVGKYTYFGDANLDGKVTSDDYVAVDVGLGTGDSWVQGDFNFSGTVTSDDYVAIDVNLGKGSPTPLAFAELKAEMVALHTAMFGDEYVQKLAQVEAEGFAALVPEPGALSLVGLGAGGLLTRRRRRRA